MKKLIRKLFNKEYRSAYVEDTVTLGLPIQIKYLRESYGLTQAKLAKKMKTTQTAISRMEDPDYGRLTVKSLLRLASVFDVALIVKFAPFGKFIEEYKDKSPSALKVKPFGEEIDLLKQRYIKEDSDYIQVLLGSSWATPRLQEGDINNIINGFMGECYQMAQNACVMEAPIITEG